MKNKKKKNNAVNKALSPEEQSILGNIQSLIQELTTGGSEPAEEEPVMAAEEEIEDDDMVVEEEIVDDEGEQEVKMTLVNKELETTPSEGPTASDDAEGRIEGNQIPESEENVTAVAKALIQALAPKQQKVEKSATELILEAVGQMANVQKSNQKQITDLSNAFGQLIQGLGIVDQMGIAKSAKEEIAQKSTPIMDSDNQNVIDFMKQISGMVNKSETVSQPEVVGSQNSVIRKNLRDKNVLRALVANKM